MSFLQDDDTKYLIRPKSSHKLFVTVQGCNKNVGAYPILWPMVEGNADHQVWTYEINKGGLLRPWHAKNLVLEAKGKTGYSLLLNELDDQDSSYQQWNFDGEQLYNKSADLIRREKGKINQCLDCWGGRVSKGSYVTIWMYSPKKVHQKWELVPLDTYEVTKMSKLDSTKQYRISLVSFYTAEQMDMKIPANWKLTENIRAGFAQGYDIRVFIYNDTEEKKKTIVSYEAY